MPMRKGRGFRRRSLCNDCRRSRWVKTVMANGSHPQKNRLITDLMNHLVQVEEDLEYHKVIMNGSWPNAVEILERALEKAKSHAAERAA